MCWILTFIVLKSWWEKFKILQELARAARGCTRLQELALPLFLFHIIEQIDRTIVYIVVFHAMVGTNDDMRDIARHANLLKNYHKYM